ncbi:MAG: hypothetical protein AAB801_01550, partial [Patescibacteria group bacterium]
MTSTSERLAQEDHIIREVRSVLTAFDSVHDPVREVVYASSPITTGKRMYELFKTHGVATLDALKEINEKFYLEQIMQANIRDGVNFGTEIRRRGFAEVIVPGIFF